MTLDELATIHLSDKAFMLPGRNGHGYATYYDGFFSSMRNRELKVLEIGVDRGASMRMWKDYFPNANIFGVDINPECASVAGERIQIVIGDQSNPEFWESFVSQHGSNWDIIIDDGGHYADQIIVSFNCMWKHVSGMGYYCVEDLGTAYHHYTSGRIQCDSGYMTNCVPPGFQNHKDFLVGKVDDVNLGSEIDFAFFSKELAIFRKALK